MSVVKVGLDTLGGRPLRRGVHEEERLACVRERDDEGMSASIRAVSAEERARLAPPDTEARLVDGIAPRTTEDRSGGRSRRRWLGRGASPPEGVEEADVVPAKVEVLEGTPPGKGVVGDVQHVIGLMVSLMELQQLERAVELHRQPKQNTSR